MAGAEEVLSLIGMSGSGKSYWSEKLAEWGYARFCCDDLITERLASELRRRDGTRISLGEWMGFPHEPQYKDREAAYLACEKAVLSEVLDILERDGCGRLGGKVVVDTTGSVIYTGGQLLERLRALTTRVNFTNPPEIREEMLRAYRAQPRPVLWRGLYSRREGETIEQALLRSYNLLLDSREKLYHALADVEINYATRSRPGFGIPDFLRIVESRRKRCSDTQA
ncbi:MAG: hypothetical protein LLG06_14265 [Desulfobacteraceae bacterium]|nr:hypothetical protein [Desulfobacteraceae bacterium]